jgi:hypothetical protein
METYIHYDYVSPNSFYNEKCFKKLYRKSKHTFYVQNFFFPPENRTVYEIGGRIMHSRTGHGRQYGARAWHAGYLRLQTHTPNM